MKKDKITFTEDDLALVEELKEHFNEDTLDDSIRNDGYFKNVLYFGLTPPSNN